MADGSIIFETRADNSKLEKDLRDARKKIASLEEQKRKIEGKRAPLVKQTNDLSKQLSKARENMKRLQAEQDLVNKTLDPYSGMNVSQEQYQAALERKKSLDGEIAAQKKQLDGLKKEWASVTEKLDKYDNELAETTERLNATKTAAGKLAIELSFVKFENKVKETAIGLLNTVKKLAVQAGKAAKAMLSMTIGNKKMGDSMLGNMKKLVLYSIGVEGLYSVFSKMRRAIGEGMTNLSQFSDSTNKSISEMRSSLTLLKNSLATAFSPILTVISPVIVRFIDMVSAAASAVARLTAMLTGQTSYVRATKVQENYAKSLAGTAAAAKEAQKSIMGFDEINKLNADESGGGGGTGSAFETVPIEPLEFESWGEAFNAMLDSIIRNGIPRLKAALTSFSVWLNNLTANIYEMFNFPGVDEKITIIGVELANAFNGLVSQINWETLGGSLGAGLDSALRLLVNFVWTFDWLSLGSSIATLLNKMISELDWKNVGLLFASKFKIAVDSLSGIIQGMDMAQLTQAASTVVVSFLNAMTETIASTNWQAIGDQIAAFLANTVSGIDWAGIIVGLAIGISELLLGLGKMIWGALDNYFDQWIQWAKDSGLSFVDGIVVGILKGAAELLVAIWDLCVEVWKRFCEYFGIHSPSTLMESGGRFLIEGLLNGIVGAWDGLMGFLESAMGNLRQFINNIISSINGMISGAVNGVNTVAQVMNSMRFTVPDWVPGFGGSSVGFNLPQITSYPQIPYLAQGAVIPPNREFLAVLGDQSHGTNIEAPLETIKQAVAEVVGMDTELMREQNDLLRQILSRTGVYLDGRELAKAITPYQRDMERARGW